MPSGTDEAKFELPAHPRAPKSGKNVVFMDGHVSLLQSSDANNINLP